MNQTTREGNAVGFVQDFEWEGDILCASSKLKTGKKRLSRVVMKH